MPARRSTLFALERRTNDGHSAHTLTIPPVQVCEGPSAEAPPLRSTTVGGLIHNLTIFADYHERATADSERRPPMMKQWALAGRDAITEHMEREFRATVAIDHVRAYVLANYGTDLTIGTARRLVGDLIRE